MDSQSLTRAMVIWTGWGRTPSPDRSEDVLIDEFGPTDAPVVLTELRRLEAEFYRSDAWQSAPDLETMGDSAAADFRSRHPEIGEDAVRALAWCYTFDYK